MHPKGLIRFIFNRVRIAGTRFTGNGWEYLILGNVLQESQDYGREISSEFRGNGGSAKEHLPGRLAGVQ
jgi:hypothetical protein